MLLLEQKKEFSGFRVCRDEEVVKENLLKMKKQAEYWKVMGIRVFENKRRLWMKKVCKFYMRNSRDLGFAQVNWKGLVMAKKRR